MLLAMLRSASLPAAVALLGVLLPGLVLGGEASLRFEREGQLVREVALSELRSACGEQTVVLERDPYYLRTKRFHALPLSCVLEQGFGAAQSVLRERRLQCLLGLRARVWQLVRASLLQRPGMRKIDPRGA